MRDGFLKICSKVTKLKIIFATFIQNIHDNHHLFWTPYMLDAKQGNDDMLNPHNNIINLVLSLFTYEGNKSCRTKLLAQCHPKISRRK